MSRPRKRWWGYVKNVIRYYPKLDADLKDLREMNIVASQGGTPRGGGTGDPVAVAATRQLPKEDQRDHDAVEQAIRETRRLPNGEQRLKIIRMVYWDRTHTVDGAGRVVGYQSAQARRIHRQFVYLVGKKLGLLREDDTPEP